MGDENISLRITLAYSFSIDDNGRKVVGGFAGAITSLKDNFPALIPEDCVFV